MIDVDDLFASRNTERILQWYRVNGQLSAFFFEKQILEKEDLVEHFHGEVLDIVTTQMEAGILKQGIEIPRGHFKTTMLTIGFAIWLVLPVNESDIQYAIHELGYDEAWVRKRMALHNINYRMLLAFETAPNAYRKISEIKLIFEGKPWFRACYPEIAYIGTEEPWSTKALKIRGDSKYADIGEATFQGMGVGGALQSQHYDIIFEDDCVGEKASDNRDIMDGTIAWHGLLNGVTAGPIRGSYTLRFLVSNPWGHADLNAAVKRDEPDFVFYTRSCYEPDENGIDQPIFPERFPREELERRRTSSNMTKWQWAAQYLCSPLPPGDQEVDLSRLHEYYIDKDKDIVCSCGVKVSPAALKRYGHYDPFNAKGVSSRSCPAIAIVGLHTDEHIFLLAYFTTRGDYGTIFDKLIELNDTWWPETWTYEDVGAQNMCEFHLKDRQKRRGFALSHDPQGCIGENNETLARLCRKGHNYFRRFIPSSTKGKRWDARIRDYLFPHIQNGKFAIRNTHGLFKSMGQTFPYPRHNDDYDLLDALAQGPLVWKFPLDEAEEKKMKIVEEEMEASIGQPYGQTIRVRR